MACVQCSVAPSSHGGASGAGEVSRNGSCCSSSERSKSNIDQLGPNVTQSTVPHPKCWVESTSSGPVFISSLETEAKELVPFFCPEATTMQARWFASIGRHLLSSSRPAFAPAPFPYRCLRSVALPVDPSIRKTVISDFISAALRDRPPVLGFHTPSRLLPVRFFENDFYISLSFS